MLSSHFVGLRKEVQQIERDNDERSSIPITIRYVIPGISLLYPPTGYITECPFTWSACCGETR